MGAGKTGGIILAAISSLTFGFVPFFSVTLMDAGFSPFEVLAYRWGVATLVLLAVGLLMRKSFRVPKGAWLPLLIVSFFFFHGAVLVTVLRLLLGLIVIVALYGGLTATKKIWLVQLLPAAIAWLCTLI